MRKKNILSLFFIISFLYISLLYGASTQFTKSNVSITLTYVSTGGELHALITNYSGSDVSISNLIFNCTASPGGVANGSDSWAWDSSLVHTFQFGTPIQATNGKLQDVILSWWWTPNATVSLTNFTLGSGSSGGFTSSILFSSNYKGLEIKIYTTSDNKFWVTFTNTRTNCNFFIHSFEFDLKDSSLQLETYYSTTTSTNYDAGNGWWYYKWVPLDDYRVVYPSWNTTLGHLTTSDGWYSGPIEITNIHFYVYEGGERPPFFYTPNYPEAVQLPEFWRYGDLIKDYTSYTNQTFTNRIIGFRTRRYHPTQLWLSIASNFKDPNYGQTDAPKMIVMRKDWAMAGGFAEEILGVDMNYMMTISYKETGSGAKYQDTNSGNWYWLNGSGFWSPDNGDGPWQQTDTHKEQSIQRFPHFYRHPYSLTPTESDAVAELASTRSNILTSMSVAAFGYLWLYEWINAIQAYNFPDYELHAADPRSDMRYTAYAYNIGNFGGLQGVCDPNCMPQNYRYEALLETNIGYPNAAGVAAVLGNSGYTENIKKSLVIRGYGPVGPHGEVNRLYNTNISWADVTNFTKQMHRLFPNGEPNDETWQLMMEDLEMTFNVLKQKPHNVAYNGGTAIQFRYDWATMLRVMKYYLPDWATKHSLPDGREFFRGIIGDSSTWPDPPPPPGLAVNTPLSNTTISGTITIDATVTGTDVEHNRWCRYNIIYPCGETGWIDLTLESTGHYTNSWDTTLIPDGWVKLYVVAEDVTGQHMTNWRYVFVNNGWDPAPCISIITPLDQQVVYSSNNLLSADIFDNFKVENAWYRIDATTFQIMTNSSNTWSAFYNVTSYTDGPHTLQIRAVDTNGNTNFESVSIIVQNDHPPSITITVPSEGEFVNGELDVKAEIIDLEGTVNAVEIRYSLISSGTDSVWSNMPNLAGDFYHFVINTANFEDKPLYIWVRAQDNKGTWATNNTYCFMQNHDYPVITWLNCNEDSYVSGPRVFNVQITNGPLIQTNYSINSNGWFSMKYEGNNIFSFSNDFSLGGYTNGERIELRVKAKNTNLFWTISTRHVIYQNDPPPTISILNPLDFQTLTNDSIKIQSEILDNDSVVSQMYSYDNVTWSVLTFVSNNLYESTWNYSSLANNNYTLSVKALDNSGQWATNSITIIISRSSSISTPTLLQPPDNRWTNTSLPQFVWTMVNTNDIIFYEIVIENQTNQVSTTNYIPSVNLLSGANMWKVRAVNSSSNKGPFSSVWTINIDTNSPSSPSLISPNSNQWFNSSNYLFQWSSASDVGSGISYYILEIDDTSSAFGSVIKTTNITSTSVSIDLPTDIYYWRVRAVDKSHNESLWSSTWSLKIDTSSPTSPILVSPYSNSYTTNQQPVFVWQSSSDALSGVYGYHIIIDGATNDVTTTNYIPLSPLTEGTHFWQVQAIDMVSNVSSLSFLWSVIIDKTGPTKPQLLFPTNGSFLSDNTPFLEWSQSFDTGIGVSNYVLMVNSSRYTMSSTNYTLLPSLPDGTNYWSVQAVDKLGNVSSNSAVGYFVIDTIEPTVVQLNSPSSNTTIANTSVLFQWHATTDNTTSVDKYIIEIDDNINFTSVNYSKITNGTNWNISGLQNNTQYYWRVKAFDVVGNTNNWSSVWSVAIDTNQVIPTLLFPTNGMMLNDNTPTLLWSFESGARSNQIVVDNQTNTVSATETNYTTGLLGDGSHIWKVRVLKSNTGQWQPFSNIFSFIIDTSSPTSPILVSPYSNSYTTNQQPVFVWQSSSDALSGVYGYHIIIDGATNDVTTTNYIPLSPLTEGTHFWQVQAIDMVSNVSSLSFLWSVIIDKTGPTKPQLLFPTNGSFLSDNTPFLEWSQSYDAVIGVSNYVLMVNSSRYTMSSTNYTLLPSLPDGTNYWSVQAVDKLGNVSSNSAVGYFVIDTIEPTVVQLNSPSSNTTIANTSVLFQWHATTDNTTSVDKYIIEIDDNINFASVNYSKITNGTNWNISGLQNNTQYYWRVKAFDVVGNTNNWSSVWSVLIVTEGPAIPVRISPTNNSFFTNLRPHFVWKSVSNASGYDIILDGITNKLGLSTNYMPFSNLTEGTHTWQVYATNNFGINSGVSNLWKFLIDRTGPVVTISSPLDGTTLFTNYAQFLWSGYDESGIQYYKVQITTNDFSSILLEKHLTNTTVFSTNLSNHVYKWRIISFDTLGNVSTNVSVNLVIKQYEAFLVGMISVSDGIHFLNIDSTESEIKGDIALNSDIQIRFSLSGDTTPTSTVQLIYDTSENFSSPHSVNAVWNGTEWVANFDGTTLTAQQGDILNFRFLSDAHWVTNSYSTNGNWGFILNKIVEQDKQVSILKNVIQKNTEDKVYIKYFLEKEMPVKISVFNISGELVYTLVDDVVSSGYHIVEWDGKNIKNKSVARGIYLIIIKTDTTTIKKVVIR